MLGRESDGLISDVDTESVFRDRLEFWRPALAIAKMLNRDCAQACQSHEWLCGRDVRLFEQLANRGGVGRLETLAAAANALPRIPVRATKERILDGAVRAAAVRQYENLEGRA